MCDLRQSRSADTVLSTMYTDSLPSLWMHCSKHSFIVAGTSQSIPLQAALGTCIATCSTEHGQGNDGQLGSRSFQIQLIAKIERAVDQEGQTVLGNQTPFSHFALGMQCRSRLMPM
jgi:hypothetical protein